MSKAVNVAFGAQMDCAFRDGSSARRLGVPKLRVPNRYTLDSSLRASWLRGWDTEDSAKRATAPCPVVPGLPGII